MRNLIGIGVSRMGLEINFSVEYEDNQIDVEKLRALVLKVCELFAITEARISVAVVGDEQIHEVNNQFLGHNYPTDVVSFDLSDGAEDAKVFDIIVNAQLAFAKAQEFGHAGIAELALYICHGLLHNLGFDDGEAEKAEKMHEKEDEILQNLGYGVVYGSHTDREPV